MLKQILNMFIAIALCFSMVPTAVFADEPQPQKSKAPAAMQNSTEDNSLMTDSFSGESNTIDAFVYFNGVLPTVKLDSGVFGRVNAQSKTGDILKVGDFLKEGYVFKFNDGGYASYNHELVDLADGSLNDTIRNIAAVNCTDHADSDGDGKCDYCNTELVASISSNGTNHVYTSLQDAIEARYGFDINDKINLLKDADGSYKVDKGYSQINLNGYSITGTLTVADIGKVNIQGTGKVNKIIFSGSKARFVTTLYAIIDTLTIEKDATWSSILPDGENYMIYGNQFGYKVYNADNTYKWYDRDTIGGYASENSSINNVSVKSLPIMSDLILMFNGKTLNDGDTVIIDKDYKFGVKAKYAYYADCVVRIQKQGETAESLPAVVDNSDYYECGAKNFELDDVGTYTIWGEVTLDGYTRRSKTYTLNVAEKFVPTGNPILSDNGTITYGGEIGKIKLSGKLYDDVNKTEVEGTFAGRTLTINPHVQETMRQSGHLHRQATMHICMRPSPARRQLR